MAGLHSSLDLGLGPEVEVQQEPGQEMHAEAEIQSGCSARSFQRAC